MIVPLVVSAILAVGIQADVYRPGNGVTLPQVVKEVRPEYTPEAKAQRIEGVVMMDCVVRSDGTVSDIAVVRSLDTVYGLDKQAIRALDMWRFKPGTKDGKPVAVKISVEMTFTLK